MPACPIVYLTVCPIQEAEATPPQAAASGGTEGDVRQRRPSRQRWYRLCARVTSLQEDGARSVEGMALAYTWIGAYCVRYDRESR